MKKILVGAVLCALIIPTIQAEVSKPAAPSSQTPLPASINCDYKIPSSVKIIEQPLLLSWSEHAALQAFYFDPATLEAQLQKLKNCFTDQGWASYNSAFEKSGNLETIKTQKLSVRSQLNGKAALLGTKNNQWKIMLPLEITYKNDKEKVTQLLNVDLTVTRKINGDLGISQIVAAPAQANTSLPSTPSNSSTSPSLTTTKHLSN